MKEPHLTQLYGDDVILNLILMGTVKIIHTKTSIKM